MSEDTKTRKRGKQHNQKLKPYVVLEFLKKYTDADNVASAHTIANYLTEDCQISAERRSVCEDINDINCIAVMLEEECDVHTAYELLEEDESLKMVVYNKHRKGYYIRQRHHRFDDVRLLAECVHTAKFVSGRVQERLLNIVYESVSEYQAESIQHDAFLTDSVKLNCAGLINSISVIDNAMRKKRNGITHVPEKISFKYLKHTINDVSQRVERRNGETYIVNPFHLLINEGNYYLLAVEEKTHKLRTYRVDRMRNVKSTGQPREGDEIFAAVNLKKYRQEAFGMYGGKEAAVTIQFLFTLLDTMVERFGTEGAKYEKTQNEKFFTVTTQVQVSDQFFGWLLGFGRRVKLLGNDEVLQKFKEYLDRIKSNYE